MLQWGFDLLYEQGPCLIVSKPGGVLTQAPPGIDSLEARVRAMLAARAGGGEGLYLGVPHRLDRPVSGVLVLATHRRAARRLAEQFERRLVQKTYWAWVEGAVFPGSGQWVDWMAKVPDKAQAELVSAAHPQAREAILTYTVVEMRETATLLEVGLTTGRMHQIRLQAAARGCPVLGDLQYGSRRAFGPPEEDPRRRWIALHAKCLALRHPVSRDPLTIEAPLPACWGDWGS